MRSGCADPAVKGLTPQLLIIVSTGNFWNTRCISPEKLTQKKSPVVMQFYYSHTFPYLMKKCDGEIRRRLIDVPNALRQRELVPGLTALGETRGDVAWQVFRNYLDGIERCIAEIVSCHSPSFWFHLHRRIRPMLADIHEGKTDDTTVVLVRRIAELAYAKHGNLWSN